MRALKNLGHGRLASGSVDMTIKVWDVAAARSVATLQGHEETVLSLAVLEGGRLASGSSDKTIKIWELKGVELTGSRSNTERTDERGVNANIVDVDALNLPDDGHSGGEAKSSNYMKMGYVSPHKALNIKLPDFSGFPVPPATKLAPSSIPT